MLDLTGAGRMLRRRPARLVVSLSVVVGAPILTATTCDTTGPDTSNPDVLWTISRFVNTDRGVVTDTSVIVGARDTGSLLSLHRSTGAVLWERSFDPQGAFFEATLVAYEGFVLAAPFHLHAVDAGTGEVRWTFRAEGGHPSRYPAVWNEALFVGTQFGEVLRLVPSTGEVEWRSDLGEAVFPVTVSEGVVIAGTRAFVDPIARGGGLGAGRVVALSAADGSVLWEVPVPDSVGFPGSGGVSEQPLVVDQTVIVGAVSGKVLALRLDDGTVLWEHIEGPPRTLGGAAPVGRLNNLAVVFQRSGALQAFDLVTGNRLWSVGEPRATNLEVSLPSVFGGRVYTVMAVNLWIVQESGAVTWRYGKRQDADGLPAFSSGPTIAPDGTIFASGTDELAGNEPVFMALRPPGRK